MRACMCVESLTHFFDVSKPNCSLCTFHLADKKLNKPVDNLHIYSG